MATDKKVDEGGAFVNPLVLLLLLVVLVLFVGPYRGSAKPPIGGKDSE